MSGAARLLTHTSYRLPVVDSSRLLRTNPQSPGFQRLAVGHEGPHRVVDVTDPLGKTDYPLPM